MSEMNQRMPGLLAETPEEESARQFTFIEKMREITSKEGRQLGRPLSCCVVTFGCQMNERDSEKIRGILAEMGFLTASEDEADFVLYNTCTVRENANVLSVGRFGLVGKR